MFQISAMININTKFEGSTNRPCAKRNEEQQELRRICELQSKLLNFGLFVKVVSFCFFFLCKRELNGWLSKEFQTSAMITNLQLILGGYSQL